MSFLGDYNSTGGIQLSFLVSSEVKILLRTSGTLYKEINMDISFFVNYIQNFIQGL